MKNSASIFMQGLNVCFCRDYLLIDKGYIWTQ